jgi:hypothetical protein
MDEPMTASEPAVGQVLRGRDGRRIGRVEAVFADYLLVRTTSLLPVDLYVPRAETRVEGGDLRVEHDARSAYDAWHRPLKRTTHE